MDNGQVIQEVDCQHTQFGVRCVHKDTIVDGERKHHEGDHEVLADDVMRAMEDGRFNEKIKINKEDERKTMSRADFLRWRQRMIQDFNVILNALHKDIVQSQVRTNLVWNGINAILMAFLDKGMITEEDIASAGQKLMREASQNLATAKQAVAENRKTTEADYTPTPLDKTKKLIYGS